MHPGRSDPRERTALGTGGRERAEHYPNFNDLRHFRRARSVPWGVLRSHLIDTHGLRRSNLCLHNIDYAPHGDAIGPAVTPPGSRKSPIVHNVLEASPISTNGAQNTG